MVNYEHIFLQTKPIVLQGVHITFFNANQPEFDNIKWFLVKLENVRRNNQNMSSREMI